jgi:hypothetical protein
MRGSIVCAAALAGIAYASSASAHHSISMFDLGKPIWIKGTVVRFEPVNPHVVFALEQRTEDGQVQLWTVEGPGLNSFNRMALGDDFLQPGDVIEVCGFTFKAEVAAQRSARDGSSRPSLHGNVLHMPDGHMQAFGGYGKIENCVRPNDSIQQWVNFLETDRRAHWFWCAGRVSPWRDFPSLTSKAFVDEVSRLLSNQCDQ